MPKPDAARKLGPQQRTGERRRSERADLVVRVDYRSVDELFSEFARNINEGGIFVETESPQPLGAGVSLEFQLPGSPEPIEVRGRVVRHAVAGSGEPPGMGIEFEDLGAHERDVINRLIRQLRARP